MGRPAGLAFSTFSPTMHQERKEVKGVCLEFLTDGGRDEGGASSIGLWSENLKG